jgi:hypothetical protein
LISSALAYVNLHRTTVVVVVVVVVVVETNAEIMVRVA